MATSSDCFIADFEGGARGPTAEFGQKPPLLVLDSSALRQDH